MFLSSRKSDLKCSTRIRILIFTHPGFRGQKGTGPRIRIRNTVKNLTYLSDQMEEELLRVLLLVRAELRVAFPNEILEHLGADAGLGALLPQQLLLHPPVRRVVNKNPPKKTKKTT